MPARHLVRLALVALALTLVPPASADGPKARDLLLGAASVPGAAPSSSALRAARRELKLPRTAGAAAASSTVISAAFVLPSSAAASRAVARWARRTNAQPFAARRGRAVSRRGAAWAVVRSGRVLAVVRVASRSTRDLDTARALALQQADGLATAPVTAGGRLLEQVAASGGVTRQVALDAFALAFGPLPGARRVRGDGGPIDGSQALRYVAQHWVSLTPAQRAAVNGLVSQPAVASAARVRPAFRADPGVQAQVNAARAEIEARLGRALTLPIVGGRAAWTRRGGVDHAQAFASPIDAAGEFTTIAPVRCHIALTPEGERDVARGRVDPRVLFIHEVFHCLQFELEPFGWIVMNDWLMEGMAEWAALDLVRPSDAPTLALLDGWFMNPTRPLFRRTYDASGFWGLVDQQVGGMWSRLPAILHAGVARQDADAYAAAVGSTDLRGTWAPGKTLLPGAGFGPVWRQQLPVTRRLNTPGQFVDGGAGATFVAPYTAAAVYFPLHPEPYFVHLTTTGATRVSSEFADIGRPSDAWLCVGRLCECPDGTRPGPAFPAGHHPMGGKTATATTGGETGESVTWDVRTVAEFCETDPDAPGDPADGPRFGGSIGDPRLISMDGLFYPFQTAGEYVLVDGGSRLKIQARQVPFRGDRSVTGNSAVAARVGPTRLMLAVRSGGVRLTIDGDVRSLADGAEIAFDGGSIERGGNLRLVRWSDGSLMTVLPVGGGESLSIGFAPAPARYGRLTGLLGDADGNPRDDLRIRGGGVIPYDIEPGFYSPPRFASEEAFHRDLIRRFGDSWRVRQRESLFFYERGQSTATFTDRSLPVRDPDAASEEVVQARDRCQVAGVSSAPFLAGCADDVAETGRASFIENAAGIERRFRTENWRLIDVLTNHDGLVVGATQLGAVSVVARVPGDPFDDMIAIPLAADGTPGPPVTVLGSVLALPWLTTRPDGSLLATVTGFDLVGPTQGVFAFGGPTWAPLAPLMTGSGIYTGPAPVAASASQVVAVHPTIDGLRVIPSGGAAEPGVNPIATPPFCLARDGNVAHDPAGGFWLAWRLTCPPFGLRVAPLDPVTGLLAGAATNLGGEFDSRPVAPLVARQAGGVFTALRGLDGSVVLQRVGGAAIMAAPAGTFASEVFVASGGGRVWVGFTDSARTLHLRRTTADGSGLEPGQVEVDPPPPATATSIASGHYELAPTPAGVHVVFAAGADGALAPEAYVVTIVP